MQHHRRADRISTVFAVVFLSLAFLAACSDSETSPSTEGLPVGSTRGDLLAFDEVGKLRADDVAGFVEVEGGVAGSTDRFASSDVALYRVSYVSVHRGELLPVSGLVLVPLDAPEPFDIWQHHHGTIIPGDDGEVPSTYRGGAEGSSEMYFIGGTAASSGYVVSMPDYVGYGISSERDHPYTVHDALAASSLDMLRATSALLDRLEIEHTTDVVLTGWSEGGGAGLATHKLIETSHADEFTVLASSLLAGPYDYAGFTRSLVSEPDRERDVVSLFNWALYSLNNNDSRLARPAGELWSYPVDSQDEAVFVPELTLRATLTPDALDGLVRESDEVLMEVITDNGLIDGWTLRSPVYLHSGTDDEIVLHDNSVAAHRRFTDAGATSTLYEYEGGDHFTPLVDYVITTLDDVGKLS